MRTHKSFHRLMAMILVFVMLMTLLPVGALADTGKTYAGEESTTEVGKNEVTGRNNNFNKGWKFFLGTSGVAQNKNFDDSTWDKVDLPHDFSIFQNFTGTGEGESGFLPGGTGWYRKSFVIDADQEGKTFLLNFDGVYKDSVLYVNGEYVGEHHYGYTNFAFDITDYLICDGATENVIAMKVENILPTSRWYSGSGIYRDVTLIAMEPVHVDLNGTQITTPTISEGLGDVNIAVEIVNDGNAAAEVTLVNRIYAKGTDAVLATGDAAVTVPAGEKLTAQAGAQVAEPKLWSLETPNLYTVVTELTVDGKVVDTYESEFGFRWFSFDSTGFHLNGENVKLNGVCMHHDQGALGSAAYYDAIYRQMSIMKDMGCNAIRVTHNPSADYLTKACNELGLLVIQESFDGLVDPKNYNSNDFSRYFEVALGEDNGLYEGAGDMHYSEYAVRSHVKRDRNNPCIIAWSFGNEIQEGTGWGNTYRFDEICAKYITWVNEVDGERPVTSGDNNRGGSQDLVNVINTITASGGIAGFNYANSASTLANLASRFGGSKGVIIASETASATNSRGQYRNQNNNDDSDGKKHLTSYDTSKVNWGATAHDSIFNTYQYDNIAGEFVWTGFDYIGEPTPWNPTQPGNANTNPIPNSSYFGIVETTGFEKDTYYLYRSQWNKDATTLHLVTAWDSDNMMTSGGKTPVWVYSNAPVVKLYRNGEHIGTATRSAVTSPAGHTYYTYTTESLNSDVCTAVANYNADALYCIFNVVYQAGTISAKAFEEDGETEIQLTEGSGNHTVSTPDAPAKLVITQDKTEINADGESLVYITVDVTDENGNLDTTATNNIAFTLDGEGVIMGVDNGDQATTRKYQQASVLTSDTTANIDAYAGKALVIVKSTEKAGTIKLSIASDGLTGGEVTVTTVGGTQGEDEVRLASYTMVRDYTVLQGTVPELNSTVTGNLNTEATVSGTVAWNEISADIYGTPGDYNVVGTATFEGYAPIQVSARLHVIADVTAMRNISTATLAGEEPVLPSAVAGVMADGTVTGEYQVEWEEIDMTKLAAEGDVLVVNGVATVLGEYTKPVTCTVRVARAVQGDPVNVAPMADSLAQDIPQGSWSDAFESINNKVTKPGDNTNERWTNWNYRTRSDNATITMTWATAQTIHQVNLYYYIDNCCAVPETVEFSYSLNAVSYEPVEHTAQLVETYQNGTMYTYTFAEPINPVGLKLKLTQQDGTSGNHCVGLTEIETMSYSVAKEIYSSADLSGIATDGIPVENFDPEVLMYLYTGDNVTATSDVNAGITILPEYEGVIRILTISEDGSETKVYSMSSDGDVIVNTAKAAAIKELDAHRASKNDIGYTVAAVSEMNAAVAEGKAAIQAAETIEAVAQALEAAKAAIDAVKALTVLDDLAVNDLDTNMPSTVTFVEGEEDGSRAIKGYYSVNDTGKVLNAAMTAGKPFTVAARVYVPEEAFSTTTGSFDGADKHNMIAALGDNTFAMRVTTNKNGSVNVQAFVHGSSGWCQIGKPVGTDFANKWHDIAATYEGTTLTLYVDGVQFDQRTDATASITDEGIPFSIGCDPTKPQRLSELTVDELLVFNECLTAEELAADHLPGDENVIFWSDYDEITAITLNQTEAELDIGDTLDLTATVAPAGISRSLTWASSDEDVAVVENGKVNAVAPGEAAITVSADNGVSAECVVTVIDRVALAKAAALEELAAYRADINEIAYAKDQIAELDAAAVEGKAAIETAETVEAVAEALSAAKAAIDAVEGISVIDDLSVNDLDTDLPESAEFVNGEAEGSRAVKGHYSVADDEHVLNAAMTAGKPFTVSTKFFASAEALDPNSGSFEWGEKFNMLAALGDNTFAMRVTTSQGNGRNIIQAFVSDGSNWYNANSDALADDFVNNWHDVTVTYEGTTLTVILDGEIIKQNTGVTASVSDSNVLFSVGWDPATNRKGGLSIDSVVVYNEALSLEALAQEHKASDDNVILWMDYEDVIPEEPPVDEDLNAALDEAVKAAQAAAEAAQAAQAAAEAAAASSAADQSAAEAAREAAEAAQEMADAAAEAAETAKQAAADFAAGAGEEAVKAAAEAAKAAAEAAKAASALATAASAAEKAQTAQAAAEKAQADAKAAADAAEKAAQSAAEDKTAAEAAQSAAEAAQSAAEAAQSAADKSKAAAEKSLEAAIESNKTAAAQAAAAASSAKAAATSASAAADAAKKTAEAAANAQEAAEKAEDAAKDTTIEKEEAEKALAEALKAKEEALAMAAATGLALEKYSATLDLEALLAERLNSATAEQAEALTEAAEAAAEAIDAAESVEALAETMAEAEANLDAILESKCAAEVFTDVNLDAWYHDAIDFVLNQGMMNGNGDGTFTPDKALTRAMLVQILYNIEGRPEVTTDKSFTDVAEGAWYEDAILWAAENEIVLGYDDGSFGAEDNVTREQMVTILHRYAGSPAVAEAELTFDDAADVDDWAVNAVAWAVENGVVKGIGDNLFDPNGNSSRAQTAQVMFNYFTK